MSVSEFEDEEKKGSKGGFEGGAKGTEFSVWNEGKCEGEGTVGLRDMTATLLKGWNSDGWKWG